MAEHTVRDALLAELLGDVGKLYDVVKDLEKRLPALLESVEKHIVNYEESISEMQSAWIAEIRNISQYNQDAANRISRELQSPDGIRVLFQAALKDAIGQALLESQQRIEREKLGRFRQISGPSRIIIAMVLGVILCGVGVSIGAVLGSKPFIRDLSSEEKRYMEAGRDIIEVMPRLDTAMRRRLEEALKEAKK
jgi:hypothetical protein